MVRIERRGAYRDGCRDSGNLTRRFAAGPSRRMSRLTQLHPPLCGGPIATHVATYTTSPAALRRVYANLRRIGLVTRPCRMARTLAKIRVGVPSITVVTGCRFGLNWRFLIEVVLTPTPPRYLALPRYWHL